MKESRTCPSTPQKFEIKKIVQLLFESMSRKWSIIREWCKRMETPNKNYWSEKSWRPERGFNEISGVTYHFDCGKQDSSSVRLYERYNGRLLSDSERYKDIPEKHREWFSDMIAKHSRMTNTYIYVEEDDEKK